MTDRVALPPLWMSLALDPVGEVVTVLGFARSEAEAKEHRGRADPNHFRTSFDIMLRSFPADLHKWLARYKVPADEIRNVLKGLSADLQRLLADRPPEPTR